MSTPLVEAVDAELYRRQVEEDQETLPGSLYEFTKSAFHGFRLMAGKKGVGASAPTQINIVNAEALKVGPDEVLIIKIGEKSMPDDGEALLNALSEILTHASV